MTQPVPKRRLYHENWRRGFIQNSAHGNELAHEARDAWLDNDFGWSSDLAWVNAHGYPETVWGRRRFVARSWADLKELRHRYRGRTYHLRDARETFRDAAALGQKVEAEVKNVKPLNRPENRRTMFRRLANHAANQFGQKWRQQVNVKMVSTMGGGLGYVLPMLESAHAEGFETLLSVRGRHRFRKTWPAYVTYVRGSLVIR